MLLLRFEKNSRVWFLIVSVIVFHAIAHACVDLIVSDMRVQLEQLAHQDYLEEQDHPEDQDQ